MNAELAFSGNFILLMVLALLILVPIIVMVFIKLFRNISFGGVLATVAVFIAGGMLLVLLAILLPFIARKQTSTVTAHGGNRVHHAAYEQQPMLQDQNSRTIPMSSTVANSSSLQDPFSEAPVVARKPHDPNSETPVPETMREKKSLDVLPDWIVLGREHTEQNKANLLESSQLVFESGLFVTREEAQYDALAKAGLKLKANLQLRAPQYRLGALEISPEEVRQVALRRSYYQPVKHNFGDVLKSGEPLQQNMYRAYLEIEDSPTVRKTLLAKWRQKTGNERTAWLGGGFGLVTLLCLGVAVYLRATHPQATIRSH